MGEALDVPRLLALLVASEMEAMARGSGDRLPMSEALQMALWRQRRALITTVAATVILPLQAAADLDQMDLF